ncbi:MAG: carbohydrate-binding domain-containing protein [Lachnospiraceae bacterium]|nr:carbohydrate-binding domain-containing protein [Lachnospiraceae bacterium]
MVSGENDEGDREVGAQNTKEDSADDQENDAGDSAGGNNPAASADVDFAQDISDMFTDRDYRTEYEESKSAVIELNGDSASCSSDAVQISGRTITITDEGTYILSGTLNDGMIIVHADDKDKPQIVLNGVDITSGTSAALYILEADKVFVTLAEGTENTLSNGGSFVVIDENNIDGAVFSKQDLTFNGSGSLTVNSPAGHGIVAKDDLVFTGGTYTVNSSSHGLDANDSVRVIDSTIRISAGKDGIHAENSDDETLGFVYIAGGIFNVSAEGDGISAGAYAQIEGGDFTVVSGGGSENGENQSSDAWGGFMGGGPGGMGGRPGGMGGGMGGNPGGTGDRPGSDSSDISSSDTEDSSTSMKGIKAATGLLINGGTFTIDAADDAIHANASITVNGGSFEIATGDDGFHADDTLTITSGEIDISESYEGLEGLHIAVSGGVITLVASDDGLNAAGGTDGSGFGGAKGNDMFGGRGGMGGMGGMSSNSDGSITISGGDLYVNASGDGIDANGYLLITGGYTVVVGPTQGDTATLDYDTTATITGGTFIGTGASGMAQTFSDSEQGVYAVSVGNQAAGTQITLEDSAGNVLISYIPELSFGVVILSSPKIKKGVTYKITVGSASGEFEAS